MVGIFHFSPTLHIFSTRRFRSKSPTTLASRIFLKVTKFQLLGAYMVATPSCHLALPVWSKQVKQLRVNCGRPRIFLFKKVFVKHWWLTFDLDWVKNGLVTVRCHEIWSIFLVPDCATASINLQSGLRQQWTGSQLIPSEVSCLLCPPKPAFSTHPQIISVV
jgi:hypothetical protein